MIFDQNYYETIWPGQGVHRHDYCESLANQLMQQHQPKSLLDIGAGCGYLVKLLREQGCDAWGLECSDYALANSCAPEHIRRGDIRNIPWASGSFDLVHSQGVWGYFPESDVQAAWVECKRVGRIQHHNIDYDDSESTHQYVISQPKEWWDNQFYPRILVACPTHECKEYAMRTWIDKVRSFTYPNIEILVSDNSPTDELTKRWSSEIPIVHLDVTGGVNWRINASMEVIRQYFLAGPYARWFNLEIDVIPEPSDVVEQLLERGNGVDWLSASYPSRTGVDDADIQQGIGQSLFSRRIMKQFSFIGAGDNMAPDGWLWSKVRIDPRFKTVEMWQFWHTRHLREPEAQ